MGVLNVIMQLRKCCNHPNLFESRPVVSPLVMPSLRIELSTFVFKNCLEDDFISIFNGKISKSFLLLNKVSSFCEWKLFKDVSKNVNLNLKSHKNLPKIRDLKFCADQKFATGSSFFKTHVLHTLNNEISNDQKKEYDMVFLYLNYDNNILIILETE